MKFLLLLLLTLPTAYGGQSLDISSGNYCTFSDPNVTTSADWRVEFQLHNFTTPASNRTLFYLNGLGLELEYRTDATILVSDKRDTGSGSNYLNLSGRTNVLVRIQRDHTNALFTTEMWDLDSSNYAVTSTTLTSENSWIFSGGGVGGATSPTASIAYLRAWSTLVPLRSKPPTTSPSGTTDLHLKFDGNLNDSGPNGRNCTGTGTVAYSTTPIGNIVYSIPSTYGSPTWTNSISCRAGASCQLDGSASYSLADAGDTVTYFWNQLSGPSTAIWDSRTSSSPTLSGLVFGPYSILLRATDASGTAGTGTLSLGAVSTDSNGVVVNANSAADDIFGPMIAFGRNPWEYQDKVAFIAATARAPGGASEYPTPSWLDYYPGTVSYTPATIAQAAQTTLNGSITSTDITIILTDASLLDWSSLPSIILVMAANTYNPIEEIRICNRSGNTLTVCYDGRGWRRGLYERVSAPQAWSSGATVRQAKTVGASTTFLTNFCPAGAGEAGSVYYSTGTVSVTAGSATLTGSGTSWNSTLESRRIRISGTTGGTPFVFFTFVSGVPASATSLTLGRVWPSDADTASGLSYAILGTSPYISRNWVRPDATNGVQNTDISACISDTQMYHAEIITSQSGVQTGQNYGLGATWTSEFGPNYYDEVLAHYAGYFRSGQQIFLDNARAIGDYWMKNPSLDEGYLQQFPRRTGLTGMFAATLLDGRTDNWYGIRKTITARGEGAATAACTADIRETAYTLSWDGLSAKHDPDATNRNQSKTWLDSAVTRDGTCRNAEAGSVFDTGYTSANSYPTPYFGAQASWTMTNGSAAVTGTGLPDSCAKVTSGTGLTLSVGQTVITGHSGFVSQPSGKIVIFAQRNSSPYLFYSTFTYVSSSAITLASPFDGGAGTYSWQIESDTNWLTIASGNTDYANLGANYACTWNSSTSITLDRPWAGSSGTFGPYRYQEVGYGTQPFLLGIRVLAMKFASQGANSPTSITYGTYAADAANWVLGTGFDSVTKGLHYARGWRGCEPTNNPRLNCTYGTSDGQKKAARFLNAEAQNAARIQYEADPSPTNLTFGDQFYGAQWGCCGPYYDSVYLDTLTETPAFFDYKWLGFFFGMGMSHQWPAVRLGGVAPEDLVTYKFQFTLPANADKVVLSVLQPSGKLVTPAECTTSPCEFTYDRRQGSHRLRWEFKTTGDVGRGPSDWAILP